MHFAAKNLLYTFNQSLGTQFVTVAAFKRYARSPEDRTFKNYFRKAKPFLTQHDTALNSWMVKNCLRKRGFQKCLNAPNPFTTYMSGRPHYALARYISLHRRKKNPILINFVSQIKDYIIPKISVNQCSSVSKNLCESLWQNKKTQNKPISKTDKTPVTLFDETCSALQQLILQKKKQTQTKPIATARERKLPDGITQWSADAHFDGTPIDASGGLTSASSVEPRHRAVVEPKSLRELIEQVSLPALIFDVIGPSRPIGVCGNCLTSAAGGDNLKPVVF